MVAAVGEPAWLAGYHDERFSSAGNGCDGMGWGLEGSQFLSSIRGGLGVIRSKAVAHYVHKDVGESICVEAVGVAKVGPEDLLEAFVERASTGRVSRGAPLYHVPPRYGRVTKKVVINA